MNKDNNLNTNNINRKSWPVVPRSLARVSTSELAELLCSLAKRSETLGELNASDWRHLIESEDARRAFNAQYGSK